MEKADFPELWDKIRSGTDDMVGKVKDTKDGFVKVAKQSKLVGKGLKSDTKEKLPKKETEPKIKLDDALRMAVDQYNDAYTMMNDNGTALHRERTRAVDMIVHIEDLVNSIANRPKAFDTEIVEIRTHRESFLDVCEIAKEELDVAKKSALGAGAGVATGAAIVRNSIYWNSNLCIIWRSSHECRTCLAWRRCIGRWRRRHGCWARCFSI